MSDLWKNLYEAEKVEADHVRSLLMEARGHVAFLVGYARGYGANPETLAPMQAFIDAGLYGRNSLTEATSASLGDSVKSAMARVGEAF